MTLLVVLLYHVRVGFANTLFDHYSGESTTEHLDSGGYSTEPYARPGSGWSQQDGAGEQYYDWEGQGFPEQGQAGVGAGEERPGLDEGEGRPWRHEDLKQLLQVSLGL